MGWYAQTNYSDKQGIDGRYTIAQIGCFLTAFCNLLRRFSKDVSPSDLNRIFIQRGIFIDVDDGVRDDLGWQSITAYDGQIHVIGTGTGWPNTNNAVLKFHYQSVQQPYTRDGKPNFIDHFCLVADEHEHTFIDSYDGKIKHVSDTKYGEPIAYAAYENVVPQPVQPVPVATPAPAPSQPNSEKLYKLGKGETITLVAQRLGYSAQELLDHNGLTWNDARSLPVGYNVRLPYSKSEAPATNGIRYELLPQPVEMHISRAGGAKKWSFGNVRSYKDFTETGFAAEGANFLAVAVAWVPIPDNKETAAYYMDANALGDFANSGKVSFTIGFNHADLAPGYASTPAPAPAEPDYREVTVQPGWGITTVLAAAGYPVASQGNEAEWDRVAQLNGSSTRLKLKPGQVVKVYKQPLDIPAPAPAPTPAPAAPVEAQPAPAPATSAPQELADKLAEGSATSADIQNRNLFKTTFQRYPENATRWYIAKKSEVIVKDYSGVRPPHLLKEGQAYETDGTFTVDGIKLHRFATPAKNGFWFGGVEKEKDGSAVLQHEDELFTIQSKPAAPAGNGFVKLFDTITKTIIPQVKAWIKKR